MAEEWLPLFTSRCVGGVRMSEQELLALLSATRKKIAEQGRIVDARLMEKERQILKALEETDDVDL